MFMGITVGGGIGGWIGALMSNGNLLSGWAIILTAVGSFIGIWVVYKANQYIG